MRGNILRRILDKVLGSFLCALLGLLSSLRRRPLSPTAPQRILWLKLAAMGDTVLLIPALRAVRKAYPEATIVFLATRINADILRHCPYIDHLIVLRLEDALTRPGGLWHSIRELQEFAPDWAIDAEQWTRFTPLLAYLSGAPRRAGFRTPGQGRHFPFTDPVLHRRGRHEVECFLDLVRTLGVESRDNHLELFLDQAARDQVEALLRLHGLETHHPLVVLHPGCGKHGKRREWAPDKYARLADLLVERYRARIVLTGDPAERPLAQEIAGRMAVPPLVAAGETDVRELAALIARSDLVVCGNTGALHLAAAAGVPTVALHGPTDPAKWGPWGIPAQVVRLGLSCSPCLYLGHEYGCRAAPCMGEMTVQTVWEAVEELLQRESKSSGVIEHRGNTNGKGGIWNGAFRRLRSQALYHLW